MSEYQILLIIFGVLAVIVLGIGAYVLQYRWDLARIRRYLELRGAEATRIRYSVFGPGWMGNRGERMYDVQYEDAAGVRHKAACRTSLLTGVYWTQDNTYDERGNQVGETEVERLRMENELLRKEVARLRARLGE